MDASAGGAGVGAFRGFGAATPYLGYGQAQEGERRYGLGWRLAPPSGGFELDLEAWRQESRTGHRVMLRGRMPR